MRKKIPGEIKEKKCLICKEKFTYRVHGGDVAPKTCGKWKCVQEWTFGKK
ncbi:unnamed protein product, partial [marine sediment metagenome]